MMKKNNMIAENTVISKDGTKIAYDVLGHGPVLIYVTGALCYRTADHVVPVAQVFSKQFTVYNYDRRGRGDSTDKLPYAVAREVEDIDALITAAGGSAFLYGHSSGAALAFEAAMALRGKVKKLAMYEAPYSVDAKAKEEADEFDMRFKELLLTGRKGEGVSLFLEVLGLPPEMIVNMHKSPNSWSKLEALAPTIAYDTAVSSGLVPIERALTLTIPTLLMYGDKSYGFMKVVAESLSKAIPKSQLKAFEGQDHNVSAKALLPVLTRFFTA
jgi:pimeloyl-ACP methyl ester carboxylesterase